MNKTNDSELEEDKAEKEYLTGRVTKGFTAKFRAAIPKGFQFGVALEVAVSTWMSLPPNVRIATLTGENVVSLPELIEQMIDERIEQGKTQGKRLKPRPRQKPGGRGLPGPDDEQSPR